jgi:hypothetical protein
VFFQYYLKVSVCFGTFFTILTLDKQEGRETSSVNRPMVEEAGYDNQTFYHRAA